MTNGHRDRLPATALTNDQISDISDYLHRRIDETDFIPQFTRSEIEKRLLTGDESAGKAYFHGAGGCAGCHSPTGDLKGIAAKYDPLTLQLRFISPPPRQSIAAVTLPSGQQFKGRLLSLDTFNVSIHGDDGQNYTWPKNAITIDVSDPLQAHWEMIPKYTSAAIRDLLAYLETFK